MERGRYIGGIGARGGRWERGRERGRERERGDSGRHRQVDRGREAEGRGERRREKGR